MDLRERDKVDANELKGFVVGWLEMRDFSNSDAATAAEVIVDADLHGVHSHGVRLLAMLAPELERRTIRADSEPQLVVDRGVTGVIDGQHGFGPVVCAFATDHVVARATELGMAAVAVRKSSHWGRPAYYASLAARRGLILIAVSNSTAAMPLWGSKDKSVGNNPVAIGVPRTAGAEPLVLDISMQAAAWGKVRLHRDQGEQLPEPWGFDSSGRPTMDPATLLASGRVRPMGDHKGSGLAVMFEALTGGLAGSLHSAEVSESMAADGPQFKSQFFVALEPAAFGGTATFQRMLGDFVERSGRLEPADGHSGVRLPGLGSAAVRERNRRDGIRLTVGLREALKELGALM